MSRSRKIQFVLSILFIFMNSAAEVASLASLIPFLAVLSDPNRFWQSTKVQMFAGFFGASTALQAVPIVCMLFGFVTIVSAVIRTSTLIINSRFTMLLGADISRIVFNKTLHQPYPMHAMQNSAAVINNVTQNSAAFVNGILSPAVALMTSGLTVIGILSTLFVVNWSVALSAIVIFGGSYMVMIRFASTRYIRNSRIVTESQDDVVKALQEGLGAIRDVIIDSNQPFYKNLFATADMRMRKAYNSSYILSSTPRYILEAVGLMMITVVAFVLSKGESKLLGAVPVLGALALGAQRLLPAMQTSYSSWTTILANRYALDRVVAALESPQVIVVPGPPAAFNTDFAFQNVRFQYTSDTPTVIDDVSFTIAKGERIGIIGATGSGKSTTMDLLLGLLPPTGGQIVVDGKPLVGAAVFGWQRILAHVPQSIYLADATIAENIAFGIPKSEIDMDGVRRAATLAQIHEHVNGLEHGYNTFVGERGIRLSGGQRQRIGIARALYKNAKVLVFDEATSALDNDTESSLMAAIEDLSAELTIIMVAHRLSTVQRCDKVLRLEQGRVLMFDIPSKVLDVAPVTVSAVEHG